MRSSSKITLLFVAVLVTVFILGVTQLFVLRFDEGDVYAPYSSFRSDPLGARALYEALAQLDDISVRRNIEPISRLPEGRETTLFVFGASTSKDPKDVIEKLETFAAQGGRIVIAFYPKAYRVEPLKVGDEDEKKPKFPFGDREVSDEEDEDKERERDMPPWYSKPISIADRWGFAFERLKTSDPDKRFKRGRAVKQSGPNSLPAMVSWHSALFFDKADEKWEAIYHRDEHPVVMQRRWIKGSIVLCSDSYFLSNEAMRKERYPELIAWLVGPSSTVIFDEMHLGTIEKPGVMSLIRRYRLEGVLVVLLVVAILFAWKNASSLTPKRDSALAEYAQSAAGKDSAAALVNLLRRSIPPHSLLYVCAQEWERSAQVKADRHKRIKAIVDREQGLSARERNPVTAYRTIYEILKERD